jgi:predicted  nucleic acid-binding Zn-ribbon protein
MVIVTSEGDTLSSEPHRLELSSEKSVSESVPLTIIKPTRSFDTLKLLVILLSTSVVLLAYVAYKVKQNHFNLWEKEKISLGVLEDAYEFKVAEVARLETESLAEDTALQGMLETATLKDIQLDNARKTLEATSSATSPLHISLNDVEQKIKTNRKDQSRIKRKTKKLEEKIELRKSQIVSVHDNMLLDELQSEISTFQTEIESLNNQLVDLAQTKKKELLPQRRKYLVQLASNIGFWPALSLFLEKEKERKQIQDLEQIQRVVKLKLKIENAKSDADELQQRVLEKQELVNGLEPLLRRSLVDGLIDLID